MVEDTVFIFYLFYLLQKGKMGFSLVWRQRQHMLRTGLMMLGSSLLRKRVVKALAATVRVNRAPASFVAVRKSPTTVIEMRVAN